MKKRTASPCVPGAGAPTDAPRPLSTPVSALANLDALEPVNPAHQTYLVKKLFIATTKRVPPVTPGRTTPSLMRPAGAKLVCDDGQLGSLDDLLHLIETWESVCRAAVLGRRMNCKRSPTSSQAHTSSKAPLP